MFSYRRLTRLGFIFVLVLTSCVSNQPGPGPLAPTPAPLHGYHLTLYNVNGGVSARYDVGPNDIVRDDPIRQNISFRVNGEVKQFHGSYQKDRY